MPNLFEDLPAETPGEVFESILKSPELELERIVSSGQSTPEGQWLKQERHEWVVLLQGDAELVFRDGSKCLLSPGDYVNIPSSCEHRVERTSREGQTVWLALHYR